MTATVVRRLGGAVLSILLVSVITFLLMRLGPGDAAEAMAGEQATAEQVDIVRQRLGLDKPLVEQYGDWLGDLVTGDFGTSLATDRPVADSLKAAAPATLSITITALTMAAALGVLAGAIAGLRNGSMVDRIISIMATLGIAMPSYWVGLLLVTFFALERTWFPATGYEPMSEGIGVWFKHIVLPATALGLATVAEVTRQTRGGVVDVLAKPYIRAARARGAGERYLVRRHVLRNAAIPVVTVFGLQAARLLGGVVIVEAVFGIPGLGTLAINAVVRRDYPVIQGYVVLVAIVVIVINLLVDTSYGIINPKVRRA